MFLLVRPVLLIEDDMDLRLAMGIFLNSRGFAVTSCGNGRDGLALLEKGFKPAVIVLDLMMPVMNGFEVLQALRADPRWTGIPVVVVSGNRGYDAGDLDVQGVIRKPFDADDLVRVLSTAA